MAFDSFVLMRDLNFTINYGDVFIIMGGSGCGKSTLLRHLIGLEEPAQGEIFYGDENFTKADPARRRRDAEAHGDLVSKRRSMELDDSCGKCGFTAGGVYRPASR